MPLLQKGVVWFFLITKITLLLNLNVIIIISQKLKKVKSRLNNLYKNNFKKIDTMYNKNNGVSPRKKPSKILIVKLYNSFIFLFKD